MAVLVVKGKKQICRTKRKYEEEEKNIDAYNLYYKNATAEAKDFLRKEVVNLAQAISDKFLGKVKD